MKMRSCCRSRSFQRTRLAVVGLLVELMFSLVFLDVVLVALVKVLWKHNVAVLANSLHAGLESKQLKIDIQQNNQIEHHHTQANCEMILLQN